MFMKKSWSNGGLLLYPEKKIVSPIYIQFNGASTEIDDNGEIIKYVPLDPIVINAARIDGYYDHTILMDGRKIRVMETREEITRMIEGAMR